MTWKVFSFCFQFCFYLGGGGCLFFSFSFLFLVVSHLGILKKKKDLFGFQIAKQKPVLIFSANEGWGLSHHHTASFCISLTAASSKTKQYSLLHFLLKVSHAFCIILHMKLFTKETLTHSSLYWLGVARRDRGSLRGGVFFLNVLYRPGYLPRKAKKARGGSRGTDAGKHIEDRHWRAPPASPWAGKKQKSAQPRPGHRHYARKRRTFKQYFNTVICLFSFSFFFFLTKKKKKKKVS